MYTYFIDLKKNNVYLFLLKLQRIWVEKKLHMIEIWSKLCVKRIDVLNFTFK